MKAKGQLQLNLLLNETGVSYSLFSEFLPKYENSL